MEAAETGDGVAERGALRLLHQHDPAAARTRSNRWATARGGARGCYAERYLVGPAAEPDHSRRRTGPAYLVAWP